MDDTEARVRCLELAANLSRPSGDYSAQGVVEIATKLYSFVNAPPLAPETGPAETTDKPRPGASKARKAPDILS